MKKVLWSTAAAALFILTLTGCADNAPVQTEDRPPQAATEISAESTAPVEAENEIVFLSAGDELPVEDGTASGEPTASPEPDTPALATTPAPQVSQPAEPSTTPVPQETPPPARITVTFEPSTGKSAPESGTEESSSPAPSATPEPTPTATPPAQSEPPAASESAFSIDQWIAYAQNYAKGAGLNLDPTATGCWDNPITAGAHCSYLERDIQSRLNRYAKDDTILDVWIWAEPRADGSYDLYIGYA